MDSFSGVAQAITFAIAVAITPAAVSFAAAAAAGPVHAGPVRADVPIPLPSLPPVMGNPSPSPSPAPSPSPKPGGGRAAPTPSASGGEPFGPSGIVSAFVPPAAASSASPGPSPPPFKQSQAPPPASYIFPLERGGAAQSAIPPLLVGLLLVSLGLWLMSMRHRREALLAASLERTKTDFLNLASHELRGPLTILKGYVSTAREGHFGELPAAFEARLPTFQNQLARMEMLVEQMLETARLDAGHPDVQREVTDLRGLVQGAIPAERLESSEHEVELRLPEHEVLVEVDARRIEQVLHNLVENALKYSEGPTRVTVRLWTDAERARVSVADQGFGIAPDDMKRLFSRFGRLVTDRNSHIAGLGLGLYLGRKVAQMHGGDLEAESTPGQGSTFTLVLPLHRETASPDGTPDRAPLQRALRFAARLLPSRVRGRAA